MNSLSLNELGFVGRGKSRHRPRNAKHLYGGKYPFIQTADVKNANLYINNFSQTYNDDGLAQSKLWEKGTLCITIAANIADASILGIDACFPDSVIGFIPFADKADVRYIKYYFDLYQIVFKQISQGAAQDNLSLEKLLSLKIPSPPLKVQQKIAVILSAYDDLIESNLKKIKLLEEMAKLTYEDWFLNQKINGEKIPETLIKILNINELTKEYKNGGWGKDELEGSYTEEAYVIRGTDMPDIKGGDLSGVPLRYHTVKNLSPRRLILGDISIEMSNGNINNVGRSIYFDEGLSAQLNGDAMCASFCKLLRPINIDISYIVDAHLKYIHQSNQMLAYKSQGANGINNFRFEDMINEEQILLPLGDKYDELIAQFRSIYSSSANLRQQIQLLKEAQAHILPRLMSGMIDVDKLEIPEELLIQIELYSRELQTEKSNAA